MVMSILVHPNQHGAGIRGWSLTQLHVCANSFMKANKPFIDNPNAHRHTAKARSQRGLDKIKLPSEFQLYSFNSLINSKLKLLAKTKSFDWSLKYISMAYVIKPLWQSCSI